MVRFDQRLLEAIFATVAFATSGCSSALVALRANLRDARVTSTLRAASLELASHAGVPLPKTIHAVAALDHQVAEKIISGTVINDHSAVYVVQITGGTFTPPRHPPGAAIPQVTVLTVTLDVASCSIMDIGYDSEAPDLTKIDSDEVEITP